MQHATKLASTYSANEPVSILVRRFKPKPPRCTCDGNGTDDTGNAGKDALRRTSKQSCCCEGFRLELKTCPRQQQSEAALQSADMAVSGSFSSSTSIHLHAERPRVAPAASSNL